MKKFYIVCFSLCSLFGISCSSSSKDFKILKIDELRSKDPDNLKVVEYNLPKAEVNKRVAEAAVNDKVRIVELVTDPTGVKAPVPQYRLFGISESSVYGLLGLTNGDVVIAADGYVIQYGLQFKEFVKLIGKANKTSIEILRGVDLIRFEYNIVS